MRGRLQAKICKFLKYISTFEMNLRLSYMLLAGTKRRMYGSVQILIPSLQGQREMKGCKRNFNVTFAQCIVDSVPAIHFTVGGTAICDPIFHLFHQS